MLPKTLISFIWHFVKYRKKWIILGCLASAIWASHVSMIPYLLGNLINTVELYYDTLEPEMSMIQFTLVAAVSYIIITFTMGMNYRVMDFSEYKLFPQLQKDIRTSIMSYMSGHSYRYFQDNMAGNIANKVLDVVKSSQNVLYELIFKILPGILTISGAIITVGTVNPIFSIIFITWAIIFISTVYRMSIITKEKSKKLAEEHSKLTGKVVDFFTSIISIKLFARYQYEHNYLAKHSLSTFQEDSNVRLYLIKMNIIQVLINLSLMISLIFTLINIRASVGNFGLILMLYNNLTTMTWYISSRIAEFAQEVGKCSQAISLLTQDYDIQDIPNASEIKISTGSIEFKNVNFSFSPKHQIFSQLSVFINSHEKIGIVGFSGTGKTTFINLLMRFLEIQSGNILIDDQDISSVTQASLHAQIAVIPQDISLFHRTIMENIRYGNPQATDEQVIDAAKKSHCHDFIQNLPEQYESLVGERGIKLSTGQRQRIAIARAILKDNVQILILDEATSALDSITEKKIQDSLEYLMEGKTVIAVAHRLSTLDKVDRILVFKDGQIIESGSHAELINSDGHYSELWNMQISGFLPTIDNS